MSFHHFTRSKALRPGVSDSDEGDVEPDVVAPSAATHPVSVPPSSQEIVRSKVETMERPESMSAELAEPVPVLATPFPRKRHPQGRARSARVCRPSPCGDSPGMPRQSGRPDHTSQRTDENRFPPDLEYRSQPLQSPPPHAP